MFGISALRQGLVERWTPSNLQAHNIRYLSLDTASQGIAAAGIGSFLAVFLVRMGASNVTVGLLSSLPALASIFLSVPGGAFAEGRRDLVRVVCWARVPLRLAYALVAVVPLFALGETGAMLVVGLWTLTALPSAVLNPAWTIVVSEVVPPDVRPRVNGNRWALLSVVTAVAVAGFGRLLDAVAFPLNYQLVFLTSFLTGLVSIYLFSRIRLPDTALARTSSRLMPRHHLGTVLLDLARSFRTEPAFARYTLSTSVFRLGLFLPVALFPIFWVQHLHATDTTIGLQATAGNAALVVAYYVGGRAAVRWGHRQVLIVATAGYALYPILTSLATTPDWLVPIAVVWGLFAAGIDIAFFEALLQACPADRRTTFVAANTAFANVAAFVGPVLGSFLVGLVDIRLVLVLAGVLCVVGAGLFYVLAVATQPARMTARRVGQT